MVTNSKANIADDLRSLIIQQRWENVRALANDHSMVALTIFRNIGILEKDSQFHALAPLLVYASTAIRAELTVEAGWALYFAKQLGRDDPLIPPQLRQIALFTHPLWHQPVRGCRVNLVRPSERHLEFLRDTFSDRSLIDSYNQFIGEPDEAACSAVARTQQAPEELRQLEWVVETKQQEPIGLVSIADLVFAHGRGEILAGFPGSALDSRFTVEAVLLAMAVAFHHLGLMKLTSYVYTENSIAQSATRKLGFIQEGVLRSHIVSPRDGSRGDLYLNGLPTHDFDTGIKINRLWSRLLPDKDPRDLYKLNLKL